MNDPNYNGFVPIVPLSVYLSRNANIVGVCDGPHDSQKSFILCKIWDKERELIEVDRNVATELKQKLNIGSVVCDYCSFEEAMQALIDETERGTLVDHLHN